jgi:hypothetical protein
VAYSKSDLQSLAAQMAKRAGLDDQHVPIFLGLIEQESNWNPNASGPTTKHGKAKGLGQLIDSTARSLGVKDPFDPVQNLEGSARYFKGLLDQFGDTGLALAAYNWGPGNVGKLINNPRGVRVPNETQNYVPSIYNRAVNYGSQLMPTRPTLAFFPGTTEGAKKVVDANVSKRTGREMPAQEARFQPPDMPPAGEVSPFGADMGMPQQVQAKAPTEEMFASFDRIKGLNDFLKQSYGPIANLVDPLPKGYDDDLMRIIEES